MNEKGYDVFSMVCGIASIVVAVAFPYVGFLGAVFAIVAIILARKVKEMEGYRPMAQAGYVTGIIGLVLNVVFFTACVACVGCFGLMYS